MCKDTWNEEKTSSELSFEHMNTNKRIENIYKCVLVLAWKKSERVHF